MGKIKLSAKGAALLLAMDCGLIKPNIFGSYNIGPFMRFWDGLMVISKEIPDEIFEFDCMIEDGCDDSPENQKNNISD